MAGPVRKQATDGNSQMSTPQKPVAHSFNVDFPTLSSFIDDPSHRSLQSFPQHISASHKTSTGTNNETADPADTVDVMRKQTFQITSVEDYLDHQNLTCPKSPQLEQAAPTRAPSCSAAVVELNERCQKLRIQLCYQYRELRQAEFEAKLTLIGELNMHKSIFTVPRQRDRPGYASKKAAKEEVSRYALQALQNVLLAESKKSPPKLPDPNWVGQLNEYAQAMCHPLPKYHEQPVGSGFTCKVYILQGVFGNEAKRFTTKKAARAEAARVAMEHLKSTAAMQCTSPYGKFS